MKAASFDYVAPSTVAAALDALAGSEDGRVLAGGQSLTPMLALRLAAPRLIVDLARIAELRQVARSGGRHIIGAMVTHAAIEDGIHDFADGGMLAAVAHGVAYLAALDAGVTVTDRSGQREIAIGSFIRGAFATALAPSEIVTAITVPELSPGARWGYYKICRKAGEFPDAIGAVVIDPERRFARIAMGALDGPPRLLDDLATRVAADGAAAASASVVAEAVKAAAPDLDAVDSRLHAVAVRRALAQALAS
jgi:carbon-monoxide dehydrogenase medium subunit